MYGKKFYTNNELSKVYRNSLNNADISIFGLLNGQTYRIEKKHNKYYWARYEKYLCKGKSYETKCAQTLCLLFPGFSFFYVDN